MSPFKRLFSSKKTKVQKPEILLEESSPSCPITAIVEQDDRVAYFYLWGPDNSDFGVRSCWIRNLQPYSDKDEKYFIKDGNAPMMHSQFCKFPEGEPKLEKEELEIVWLEEGDGAALLYRNEILAIIPTWSGYDGFFGYATSCNGEGDFAWELTNDNELISRVAESQEYWESWDQEPVPFQIQQPVIIDEYEETFGKLDKYYAIDGEEWPPRGLYLRTGESKTIFATVGLSLLPMPIVEMYVDDRLQSNRIELGMMLNSSLSEDEIQGIANWFSSNAPIPWANITFLGEGHTIRFPKSDNSKLTSVILTNQLEILPKPELGSYRNSDITFLWMVPISEKERDRIINKGSEEIIKKLNAIGSKIFNLSREEVV
ncbi:suppressor of fused domain protein [Marinigracilibium pacificum]|uniref:Suppressor of fused domain protein n=1 Tax=Marinigracilibium pacificum TaxID=2729599 RepID=A0A848J004_9BACT|nr:suppressor of fused domain protein [Marinigracilibium pacificum]NMM47804.1 suppressor of fused domain protein [Marinigracilibium pacificum]